jgi:hypothetical protein
VARRRLVPRTGALALIAAAALFAPAGAAADGLEPRNAAVYRVHLEVPYTTYHYYRWPEVRGDDAMTSIFGASFAVELRRLWTVEVGGELNYQLPYTPVPFLGGNAFARGGVSPYLLHRGRTDTSAADLQLSVVAGLRYARVVFKSSFADAVFTRDALELTGAMALVGTRGSRQGRGVSLRLLVGVSTPLAHSPSGSNQYSYGIDAGLDVGLAF